MSRGRRISRVKFIPPSKEIASLYLREFNSKTLYHTPRQYPALTRQNLFERDGLISLDIGCGTGEFTNALAGKHSDQDFVGIEISRRTIYHAVNEAARLNLNNILFLRADVKLFGSLLAKNSLQDVFINFPDPNYGGENRRKHRIFTPGFLDLIHSSLSSGGSIQVVTDQEPFLLDMLEIAERDLRFKKAHSERYLENISPPEKTRFQIAWEKYERPVFRFTLNKTS